MQSSVARSVVVGHGRSTRPTTTACVSSAAAAAAEQAGRVRLGQSRRRTLQFGAALLAGSLSQRTQCVGDGVDHASTRLSPLASAHPVNAREWDMDTGWAMAEEGGEVVIRLNEAPDQSKYDPSDQQLRDAAQMLQVWGSTLTSPSSNPDPSPHLAP